MRLSPAAPRLYAATPRTADRELQLVRAEAARHVAGPVGGAAASAAPGEGMAGAVSHLFGTITGFVGAPAAPGAITQGLGGILGQAKNALAALTGRLGQWLSPAPGADWNTGLPPVGVAPAPAPKPPAKPPADAATEALKRMTPERLAELGRTNKAGFFAALRPAAEEAERIYKVPASVILAQAALETGWGQHIIPGYNIFGHKGTGPAGTVTKRTWEVINGKTVWIDAGFAKYHNFYEAVSYAGKRYHNGYYDKAVANYAKYHDPERFARDITGIYATDPAYGSKLTSIMKQYKLNG
ncbi:MAG: glycoside hydrolase family 73 protein [Candidatus Sericytochromatia bacterium]